MDSSARPEHAGPGSIVAADRAGALVTQQVQAILQQATMYAQEVREGADVEAAAVRETTLRALQAVIAELETVAGRLDQGGDEHQSLAQVRDRLGEELDGLRALARPLGEDSPVEDRPAVATAGQPVDEPRAAPPPPAPVAVPSEPVDQAQSRVAASTDDELVDQYEAARTALKSAERGRSDEDPGYWSTYLDAIVREAARRDDFGGHLDDEELPKRDRKREARRYQELLEAREQLRAAGSA